jgi:hypothetical protein
MRGLPPAPPANDDALPGELALGEHTPDGEFQRSWVRREGAPNCARGSFRTGKARSLFNSTASFRLRGGSFDVIIWHFFKVTICDLEGE